MLRANNAENVTHPRHKVGVLEVHSTTVLQVMVAEVLLVAVALAEAVIKVVGSTCEAVCRVGIQGAIPIMYLLPLLFSSLLFKKKMLPAFA